MMGQKKLEIFLVKFHESHAKQFLEVAINNFENMFEKTSKKEKNIPSRFYYYRFLLYFYAFTEATEVLYRHIINYLSIENAIGRKTLTI